MIKKFIGILALIILILMLNGCQKKDTKLDPKKPVVVTLWHYYAGEKSNALGQAVFDFNKTVGIDRGVVVNAIPMGTIRELEQNITDSAKGIINSDPMPNIFSCYPDKALEIHSYGKLTNLNNYFTDEEKEEYIPEFLEGGFLDEGQLLLIPTVQSTEILYMNGTAWKEFAEEMGYGNDKLTTWENLYEVARQYYHWTDEHTPGLLWDGKAMLGFDSLANYIIAANRQLGFEIISSNEFNEGKVVLNKDALRRIFEVYYKGYSMGYFDTKGRFGSDDVKTNDLIGYVGSTSGAAYFPTKVELEKTKEKIDFMPSAYPVFSGGDPYVIQQGAGMAVTKTDDAKEEGAVLFLKWFTSQNNNIKFALTTDYLPVKQEAYLSEQFSSALDKMEQGEKNRQNVAKVYEIVLEQIIHGETYANRPFKGSYEVRLILQDTLIKIAETGRDLAFELKEQHEIEEKVLEGINTNEAFKNWLDSLEEAFTYLKIPYEYIK